MRLTGSEFATLFQLPYIRLDLQGLVDIEERRRRRFSIIFTQHRMKHDGKIGVRQKRRGEVRVDNRGFAALFQVTCIESFVREFENGRMGSEVFG